MATKCQKLNFYLNFPVLQNKKNFVKTIGKHINIGSITEKKKKLYLVIKHG